MGQNSIDGVNTARIRPVRPPPPDPEKIAALRKKQNISSQVGNTPRDIRKTDTKETPGLSTKADDSKIIELPKKTLRERAVNTYENTKSKAGYKLESFKAISEGLNEARKEWQKAPLMNSLALGIDACQTGKEKLKSKKQSVKQKLAHKKEHAQDLYARAKAGAQTWNEAKLDTTVALAISLYQGGKKSVNHKRKSLKNFIITAPRKVWQKLSRSPQSDKTPAVENKSIKERECKPAEQQNPQQEVKP